MKQFDIRRILFDKEIRAVVTVLDKGANVILAGGNVSHIGAVTVANCQGEISTTTFAGHKENIISEKWACRIFGVLHETVVVEAGIHYDQVKKEEIKRIVEYTDDMLEEILVKIVQ